MTAERQNVGKPQLSEILKFDHALDALARVMEEGAKKYSQDNWLKGGKEDQEYFDCAARHLKKMVNGEKFDPDMGVLHAAEVAWNMLAYIRLNCSPYDAEVQELFRAKPGTWLKIDPMTKTRTEKLPPGQGIGWTSGSTWVHHNIYPGTVK